MKSRHKNTTGREKEIALIKQTNQAVAVARLMLKELDSWEDFLEPSTTDYSALPRKQLKSGKNDIKKNLNKEIKAFCSKNFQGVTKKTLSKLYIDICKYRGLDIPLKEFEKKYGKVNPSVIKGNPSHLTVHISLWGLQFLFPEDLLTKDIIVALSILQKSLTSLSQFKDKTHHQINIKKPEVSEAVRQKEFAQRSIILCCFNLLESFLNGIAWDYGQNHDLSKLSNRKRNMITDAFSVSFRDKLLKYPRIISESELDFDDKCELFIEIVKPFRDSLVHPSPFSAPEKFGGYNKLRKIYDLNEHLAIQAVDLMVEIILSIYKHIYGEHKKPEWLIELAEVVENTKKNIS